MTREEAREILTHNWTRVDNPNYSESELDKAYDMAIEALSADTIPIEKYHELQHQFVMLGAAFAGLTAVVRCKDCRFAMVRTKDEMNKPIKPQPILCEWLCIGVENDAYCSHGERREP